MSLAEAAVGLAVVAVRAGLHGYDKWPDRIQTPAAIVVWTGGIYDETQGSTPRSMTATALLVLVMQITSAERASAEALTHLEPEGEKSIVGQLNQDSRLGGRVSYAIATGFDRYEPQAVNGVDFMCPAVQVEVRL